MSYASILLSGFAFYLAHGSYAHNFWQVSYNAFSFDLGILVFVCLVINGIVSILLGIAGLKLIKDPECLLRYFCFAGSLSSCVALLVSGSTISNHAYHFTDDMDLFCQGGFPNIALITETYLNAFREVEINYIERYMCKDFCACTPKINRDKFGSRADEFDGLSFDGTSNLFYDDCYLKGLRSGRFEELKPGFISLLKEMELANNCQGLCNPNLFYFHKSNERGPPPNTCQEPIKL